MVEASNFAHKFLNQLVACDVVTQDEASRLPNVEQITSALHAHLQDIELCAQALASSGSSDAAAALLQKKSDMWLARLDALKNAEVDVTAARRAYSFFIIQTLEVIDGNLDAMSPCTKVLDLINPPLKPRDDRFAFFYETNHYVQSFGKYRTRKEFALHNIIIGADPKASRGDVGGSFAMQPAQVQKIESVLQSIYKAYADELTAGMAILKKQPNHIYCRTIVEMEFDHVQEIANVLSSDRVGLERQMQIATILAEAIQMRDGLLPMGGVVAKIAEILPPDFGKTNIRPPRTSMGDGP